MKTIQMYNDIVVEWTVERFGVPEDFTGKKLKVYLANIYCDQEIKDYEVQDNTIRFVFEGRQQKVAGKYALKLVENPGEQGMFTIKECDVFCLTDGCIFDRRDCKVSVKSNIILPANGLSAYELAVRHGYKGTEDDFAEQFGLMVLSSQIRRICVLTQSEYDALEVKDGSTMYVITEG